MPLIVLPALEAELEPFYDVWFAAFKGQAVVSVLFPEGADRKVQIQYIKKGWGQVEHPIKCVDTDTGDIVGMAIWEIFWRLGEENGWEKPDRIPWLSGEDWDKAKGVILPMWDMREKLFGKRRHVYHRRRGAGRLLAQWGIDIAEQLKLPIYLEATFEGVPLYDSVGFKRVSHEKVVLPEEVTGHPGDVEVPLMIKMPSAAKDVDFETWSERGYPETGLSSTRAENSLRWVPVSASCEATQFMLITSTHDPDYPVISVQ
ncbi:hypothetical protein DL766_004652 [Monosporascus sp. MC13-8B]|uniref:N-acetyltransferase domain-containing protein n=1 Tax=Monosporascus cannonballus TaxID=155416 RepID=A0ABY0HE57_9PEZI|nr:hypothetical protein DL763_008466 [Monosporascus cannonballus]RYO91445.1 hypothetical protein DL762_002171 [Monosporascus cannonballus]RYP30933.1 hypothetical protein DL766_004652 [Monosporascus sp. MC13-8B]